MSEVKLLPLHDIYSSGEVAMSNNTRWVRLEDFDWHIRQERAKRDAEVEALRARAERLEGALRRLLKSFPEEGVLLDAGWDGVEVDEACEAYDAARAALEQESNDA